ncbi:hypothetical protein BU26DRAFT_502323 [Trematosphaeria pertusa]|uniref:Uncharacterized protein n=1 Tax=Trematosphaeria pertusa TaxID=390896 RepID=A0A6A6IMA7_9PLEO|nr:uncharacterized protein BU26DRAFT_502323 [Trematosphaeria pertusa]KAF2251705.1 hypothetical protein BU26DRAFT_502323 [Trematosphaeria pertusa]
MSATIPIWLGILLAVAIPALIVLGWVCEELRVTCRRLGAGDVVGGVALLILSAISTPLGTLWKSRSRHSRPLVISRIVMRVATFYTPAAFEEPTHPRSVTLLARDILRYAAAAFPEQPLAPETGNPLCAGHPPPHEEPSRFSRFTNTYYRTSRITKTRLEQVTPRTNILSALNLTPPAQEQCNTSTREAANRRRRIPANTT